MPTTNFTSDETLLAADRFWISKNKAGAVVRLADDFMEAGKHLSSITDCLKFVRTSLERGHKVSIEVSSEHSRISPASSP